MKKENRKIFLICFVVVYIMIASLSMINRQPLVFVPGYSLGQFIVLFFLLGFLSFGLVFLMENLEKLLDKYLTVIASSTLMIYAYFLITSILGLFVFTLFSGFAESGRPFFYYRCVTNSCIYLLSGYTVTIIAAIYFARHFVVKSGDYGE